jgi:hypothetical protein
MNPKFLLVFLCAFLCAFALVACSSPFPLEAQPDPSSQDQTIPVTDEEDESAAASEDQATPSLEDETPDLSDLAVSERQRLAQQVLASSRINLLTVNPSGVRDGADPRSNIRDTAAGTSAKRSCYGNAPCGRVFLSVKMLRGMLTVANTYSFRVTAIAGASHSPASRHYRGVAFDVDVINARAVNISNPFFKAFMQRCRNLGATELIGPPSLGHKTHVHCAW